MNPDDIDLSVDPSRADSFYDAIRKYWPKLQDNGLVPDYAGIRPKSAPKGSSQASGDFVISGPKTHKVDGFIDLIGIESPGLTSSMAIGEEIVRIKSMNNNPLLRETSVSPIQIFSYRCHSQSRPLPSHQLVATEHPLLNLDLELGIPKFVAELVFDLQNSAHDIL